MKESYRLNKNLFVGKINQSKTNIQLALLYNSKKEEEYSKINESVIKILEKIVEKIS